MALSAPLARPARAAGRSLDLGTAIDVAGRQRMLSQRIVKAYCQIGLDVTPEASRQQLRDAVRRFDQQLVLLSRTMPTPAARRALERSAQLWRDFRRLALGPVTQRGARQLAERSEPLLLAAHELVVLLQDAAGTPHARLVATAGRQRMLSQRLAKLYMLRAWQVDRPDIRDQIDSLGHEFSGALAALRQAPENTARIAKELEAVELQWEWFSGAIAMQGAQSYALVVAEVSESILHSMELITGLYAEASRG